MDEYKFWEKRKTDLLGSINAVMEKGSVDKEVLEIMKELVENIKPKKQSMEDYLDDLE